MKTAALLLISFSICTAWWEVGHMLTAQVAKQILLQNDQVAYSWAEELVFSFNDLTDGRSNTFVEAAVWPDDIKETGTNFLDDWHYTDRPINDKGLLIQMNSIQISYNSVDAMKRAKSVLTNSKYIGKQTWAKAQMIRYVLHVVGDMHQPLHNSNFYNDTFKTGDVGGNFIKVKRVTGEQVNLHAYWDAGAFVLQPSDDYLVRPLNDSAIIYMENLANTLITKYPKDYFAGADMTNPDVWSQDGYLLAQSNVYPGLEKSNQLTPEYQKQAAELVEKQIVLGGYRLAQYISDIYALAKITQQQIQEQQSFLELKFQELRK